MILWRSRGAEMGISDRSNSRPSMLFFFKQKTAYELEYGLVGSEMCIGDGPRRAAGPDAVRVRGDVAVRPGECYAPELP